MVKANELRIGNYLIDSENRSTFKVHEFLSDRVRKSVGLYSTTAYTLEEVEPVPLTEEWLVKLGFKKETWSQFDYKFDHVSGKICGYVIDNVWCLVPAPGGTRPVFFGRRNTDPRRNLVWNFEQMGNPPSHVHQLQNLYFALTGEELEVKE